MKWELDLQGIGFIAISFNCSYCDYTYQVKDAEAIKRLFNKKARKCPLCERN